MSCDRLLHMRANTRKIVTCEVYCLQKNSWRKLLCTLQSLGKHTVVHHRTGRVAIHELLFAQRHTITFQALSAGVTLSLLRHRSHRHAASLAAALHPRNVCCTTGPLRSRQGILHHISLCCRHTCVVSSSTPGALKPAWRLGLLHALNTALDKRVVVRDGVIILNHSVTMLRYHV